MFYGKTINTKTFKTAGKAHGISYTFNSKAYGSYQSGWIHHVTLTGLEAETVYYYQVGNRDLSQGISRLFSFSTLPAAGSPSTLAILGDIGQTLDSATTATRILENPRVALVLQAGDMSYADTDQSRWDSFGRLMEPLTASVPFMVAAGNHEIESDSLTGHNFVAYQSRFNMPALAPPVLRPNTSQIGCRMKKCVPSIFTSVYDYGNSFYSFNAVSAHVVVLNPYTQTWPGSPQYEWLLQDLASVNRSETPWVWAVTHCPFYTSSEHHRVESQTIAMREHMEELLLRHRVNAIFSGHVHAYERSFPMARGRRDKDGIVYITVGAGGNREGHADFRFSRPGWSAVRDDRDYGYGTITMHNCSHSEWRWIPNGLNLSRATPGVDVTIIRNSLAFCD